MAKSKKSYLSLLPRSARDEVETVMRERDGALSFPELVARRWDFSDPTHGAFGRPDRAGRLHEARATLAARRPDWSADQVDDAIRLALVSGGLREIGIARRCALDDPAESARLLAASHRLGCADLGLDRPDPEEVCAVGGISLARRLAVDATAGYTAVVSAHDLHSEAIYALLRGDRRAFGLLVRHIPAVCPKPPRPWLEGIHVALKGADDGRPDEVARGLALHLSGLHKMQQKDALDGAVKLKAHGLYRALEWHSPGLVSEFDAAQPFPWDAAFHAWVSEHPDPAAGWDLSGTPPLVRDIVGRGETPAWLVPPEDSRYEIVLLGGDGGSRPLLDVVEQLGGGDGSLRSARQMLAACPVILRWGIDAANRGHLDAAKGRIEANGGRAEVRRMRSGEFRHFIAPPS